MVHANAAATTRCSIWGEVCDANCCSAVYHVHWTLGGVPAHSASIDLIIGAWDEHASPSDRRGIALAYRVPDTRPSMMVIDADTRPLQHHPWAGHLVRRDDIIGTPAAAEAFAIADAVLIQDKRPAEILCGWSYS